MPLDNFIILREKRMEKRTFEEKTKVIYDGMSGNIIGKDENSYIFQADVEDKQFLAGKVFPDPDDYIEIFEGCGLVFNDKKHLYIGNDSSWEKLNFPVQSDKQIFEDFCEEYNITCFDFKKIGRNEYASEQTKSAFIIFKYSNYRSNG